MRLCACLLAAALTAFPQDAHQIILLSAERDQNDLEARRNFTYTVHTEQFDVDKAGRLSPAESETREVLILYGRPYERLIARNGRPLSPADQRREKEKLEREAARRARQAASDRAKQAEEENENLRRQKEILREVAGAFDFCLLGEEILNGSATWVIAAEPKPGYRPSSRQTRILSALRGKVWITQQDYRWVKIEAEVIRTISFGMFLARLNPGTTLKFEQQLVRGEAWLPGSFSARIAARVGLVKKYDREIRTVFYDYRRFSSDSRVVSFEEKTELSR